MIVSAIFPQRGEFVRILGRCFSPAAVARQMSISFGASKGIERRIRARRSSGSARV